MSKKHTITSCLLRGLIEPDLLLASLARLLGVGPREVRPLLEATDDAPRFRVELQAMDRGFRSYITVYGEVDPSSIVGTDLQLARALAQATGMDALAEQPDTYAAWTLIRPDGTGRVVQQVVADDSDDVIIDEHLDPGPS